MNNGALVFVGLLLVIAALWRLGNREDAARERLKALWGQKSAVKRLEDDLVEDVAAYWRKRAEVVAPEDCVDDITWADLDMDDLFRRLDTSVSVVGSEALYAMLRETGTDAAALHRREEMIEALRSDENLRIDVQQALLKIGRRHFHGATAYLYRQEYGRPGVIYDVLALVPVALLLGSALFYPWLLLGLIPSFIVNLAAYYRADIYWAREMRAVGHIASVIAAAHNIGKGGARDAFAPEVARLDALRGRLRSIRRWSKLCAVRGGGMDILLDYLRITFLLNIVGLRRAGAEIGARAKEVREIYAIVGEMDALIAVAAAREVGGICAPEFISERRVEFRGLCHPLVERPVPNDGVWQRGTLVTGSNASGKSTFIKALAINAILAQTIHCCYADEFRLCRARVMSSMAIRDSVQGGESYFVAEMRSLKRILDASAGEGTVFAFVDEILRGTNTVERIAASSAVLRAMQGGRALIMAATHDIELTRILPGYENAHFREAVGEGGIVFDYKLRPGPSTTRNAIALIEQMGFGEDIASAARDMAARFEREQRWPTL